MGFTEVIEFDSSKPDGVSRKWVASSRLNALGWQARIDFTQGLAEVYKKSWLPKSLKTTLINQKVALIIGITACFINDLGRSISRA